MDFISIYARVRDQAGAATSTNLLTTAGPHPDASNMTGNYREPATRLPVAEVVPQPSPSSSALVRRGFPFPLVVIEARWQIAERFVRAFVVVALQPGVGDLPDLVRSSNRWASSTSLR